MILYFGSQHRVSILDSQIDFHFRYILIFYFTLTLILPSPIYLVEIILNFKSHSLRIIFSWKWSIQINIYIIHRHKCDGYSYEYLKIEQGLHWVFIFLKCNINTFSPDRNIHITQRLHFTLGSQVYGCNFRKRNTGSLQTFAIVSRWLAS